MLENNMNTKKILILLSLFAIAIIARAEFFFLKFRSNPIINNPSSTPSPQAQDIKDLQINSSFPTPSSQTSPQEGKNLQIFIDKERGISFQYPQEFVVNAGMDFMERYAIHLKLKDQPNDTNHLNWDIDAMKLAFSRDKIENIIKGYREDNTLDNLIIDDISVGDLHGKKVSFTGGIGDAVVKVLLPWKQNVLLEISYFPPYSQEDKDVYKNIIASIKQIN